jgi:hypothetical protein
LKQYKGLTDNEFNEVWEDYKDRPPSDIEGRIASVIDDFSKNYDLRDMNANDTLALRELARIFVQLEELGLMEQEAIDNGEVSKISALSKIKKEYLDNASKIQSDLNITRRTRQNDSGETLETYLPSIQKKARNFLSQRLAYIYCPKCRMLVANVWFTNWELKNDMRFTCPRVDCDNTFTVTSEFLFKNKNRNIDEVLSV